jgi:hypothetical protein
MNIKEDIKEQLRAKPEEQPKICLICKRNELTNSYANRCYSCHVEYYNSRIEWR